MNPMLLQLLQVVGGLVAGYLARHYLVGPSAPAAPSTTPITPASVPLPLPVTPSSPLERAHPALEAVSAVANLFLHSKFPVQPVTPAIQAFDVTSLLNLAQAFLGQAPVPVMPVPAVPVPKV